MDVEIDFLRNVVALPVPAMFFAGLGCVVAYFCLLWRVLNIHGNTGWLNGGFNCCRGTCAA